MDAETLSSYELLSDLCKQGIIGWPIDFELSALSEVAADEELSSWGLIANWKTENDKFIKFGQDGSGSSYLLWQYAEDFPPAVVFLGSEGETYNVAPTLSFYMRYLASGCDFGYGEWFEPEPELDPDAIDRNLLSSKISAVLPQITEHANELNQKSLMVIPSFESWVKSKT
ncbi:hypothetical protein [Pseudoalteromonas luteoviolacea]|uniref:hypothetical protein n=1 Tax=Pseudoalteromonas luteoviolacea TaxID=43657 RepID=UPI001B35F77C|nr:hypothetical protein [Pseudoalteromonas luteoviolacea]MBQ4838546.1 hypothetical protein [Pseudoalteromonas luteoviolacea]